MTEKRKASRASKSKPTSSPLAQGLDPSLVIVWRGVDLSTVYYFRSNRANRARGMALWPLSNTIFLFLSRIPQFISEVYWREERQSTSLSLTKWNGKFRWEGSRTFRSERTFPRIFPFCGKHPNIPALWVPSVAKKQTVSAWSQSFEKYMRRTTRFRCKKLASKNLSFFLSLLYNLSAFSEGNVRTSGAAAKHKDLP